MDDDDNKHSKRDQQRRIRGMLLIVGGIFGIIIFVGLWCAGTTAAVASPNHDNHKNKRNLDVYQPNSLLRNAVLQKHSEAGLLPHEEMMKIKKAAGGHHLLLSEAAFSNNNAGQHDTLKHASLQQKNLYVSDEVKARLHERLHNDNSNNNRGAKASAALEEFRERIRHHED